MKKKTKKIIVNSLTLSRIAGMLALPILFNTLTAPVFLLVISILFFTDFLDGLFAKKIFKVKTIGGAILDMTADKLLVFGVFVILSGMYPIMSIPLIFEVLIAGVNIIGGIKGNNNKSSETGRMKTVYLILSACALLLLGMSPEMINSFNNAKIIDFLNFIQENQKTIKDVSITTAIVSESMTLRDYSLKAFKNNNKKIEIEELKRLKRELINKLKQKEFYKNVLFDEKYNDITNELTLKEKLFPNKEQEEKIKKLTLNFKNSINSIDK